MEPIRVKSKVDFNDYCKITYKKHYSAGNLFLLLVLFLVLQVFVFEPAFNPMYEVVVVAIVIGFYGLLIPLVLYVSCRRNMRLPMMQETLTYTINQVEIDLKGESINTILKWEQVKRATESDGYFVLFTNANAIHYLPKQGFASNSDMERFKEVIKLNNIKAYFKKQEPAPNAIYR